MPVFGSMNYYHCGAYTLIVKPMEKTEIIKDQKLLMAALMEAAHREYSANPEAKRGDIVVGANAHHFSIRTVCAGIPFEGIVRALYPMEGENPVMSDDYPIESLMGADALEVHSFRNREHATLRYEKGKRVLFNIEPDEVAPAGVLIRIEWGGGLLPEKVFRKEGLLDCLKCTERSWRPPIFFNGERIVWGKLDINK